MQDGVLGRGDAELGEERCVGLDAVDLEGSALLDVSVAEEGARGEGLVGTERSQADGLSGLGGAVAVTMEDVDAEDLLLSCGGGSEGRDEERLGEHCSGFQCSRLKRKERK